MSTVLHIQQLSDYLESHPHTGDASLRADLLVPSGAVGCYALDVSEVPKRFLQQALPAMLEDSLAEDIEAQHFNHSSYKRNTPLYVLVTHHEMMQQWLDSASSSGIELSGIYPDFYAVPFEDNRPGVFINDEGYAVVRTGEHQGFSGSVEEVTALLHFVQDLSVIHCYSSHALPASVDAQLVFKPELEDFTLSTSAINLCSGQYDVKPAAQNPYTGWGIPMVLAACLMLTIGINNWVQARHFNTQAELIEPKVEQDYRQVFGEAASAGWQSRASYQTQLARAQLNSPELSHWQLLKSLNEAIASCRSCQIDELTINNNSVLLTVKTEGSASLVSSLESSAALVLESKEPMQNALSLKLKAAGA